MAFGRLFVTFSAAIGAAFLTVAAVPAAAQSNDAPIDVTAAPPSSADSVGPAQLRNFSLGGPSTRPAPSPTSSSAPLRPVEPPSSAAPDRGGLHNTAATSARSERPAPTTTGAAVDTKGLPADDPVGNQLTVPQATEVAQAPEPVAKPDLGDMLSPPTGGNGLPLLPWLAALVALLGAAGLVWWMRRQRQDRYNDPGRVAFAGPSPENDDVAPLPPHVPTPYAPRSPAPQPEAVAPAPRPRVDDGMIVSRSLKPLIRIDFRPDRLLINDKEIAVQFDVVVANDGAAPARDVLVEAVLFTASAGQDEQIASFFRVPRGQGDRIAAVAPLAKIALKSVVRMPIGDVQRFTVEDRDLFVPLVAFNILFRSSTGEEQVSASYLVGRGADDIAKLAPFVVEQGPKIINGLSARPHSTGLTAA